MSEPGYGSFGLGVMTPGAVIANDMIESGKHDQLLSDQERQVKFDQYNSDIAGMQKNLGQLDPNSPEYKDLAGKLTQAQQDRIGLFHPQTQGLDGIRHLVQMLRGKHGAPAAAGSGVWTEKIPGVTLPGQVVGGEDGSPQIQGQGTTLAPSSKTIGVPDSALTPGQIKQQLNDRLASYGVDAAPRATNPILQKKKLMKDAGFTDEQIQKSAEIDAGLEPKATAKKASAYTMEQGLNAEGKPMVIYRNKTDPSDALDSAGDPIDPAILRGFIPKSKAENAPKVGSFGDFMIQGYGQHPTEAQYEEGRQKWAESVAGTTSGTHMIMVPQLDGTIKIFQVNTTSTKTVTGAGNPTPGDLKAKAKTASGSATPTTAPAKSTAAAPLKSGDVVGGKLTPAQTKADEEYNEAIKLASVADQVAKNPNDAVNVKGFAIALERARAGRFTTQALDVMLDAGWANKLEQWANKPESGTLPADVLRQLIDGAHQNVTATLAAKNAAHAPAGGAAAASTSVASSGKAVSLAAAKALPVNKGKTDEQIKADIIAHGHTVTD